MPKDKIDPRMAEMFVMCISDFTFAFHAAHARGPFKANHIRTALFGLVSKVITDIPDDMWEEMQKVNPCGTAGCDCHVAMKSVMEALTKQRKWAKDFMDTKEGVQTHEM